MKEKKEPIVAPMSHIIEVKKKYTDAELIEFGKKFAESQCTIFEKQAEAKAFSDDIKADILALSQIINNCAEEIKSGYKMTSVNCLVTYEGNMATFTDKASGEIVEKREMSEEEQLRLSSKWTDAENVIRQSEE